MNPVVQGGDHADVERRRISSRVASSGVQPRLTRFSQAVVSAAERRASIRRPIQAGVTPEGYDAQPLFDRNRLTLTLNVNRDLNASLSAIVSADYSRQDFTELDRRFTDLNATVGLRWKVTRTSFLSLDYRHLDRQDDASGADYTVNELWLKFGLLVGERAGGDLAH